MTAGLYRTARFRAMNTDVEAVWLEEGPAAGKNGEAAAPGPGDTDDGGSCGLRAAGQADAPEPERLAADIADWFAYVEQTCSRFLPDSGLARLNRSGPGPALVSPALLEVLTLADRARRWTNGCFEPFILPALETAGYDVSFERLAEREEAAPAEQVARPAPSAAACPLLRLDPAVGAAAKAPEARLDLGGLAKGWAVDRLAVWLKGRGVRRGLINAGGDLAVWGAAEEEPWLLDVAAPAGPEERIAVIRLTEGAAATSSIRRRSWRKGGEAMHHLIDPRTGRSAASDVVQCTVIGSRAADCEVWAKTMCIAGREEGTVLLEGKAPELLALLALADGRLVLAGSGSRRSAVHFLRQQERREDL
ncbi:hypothetical protein J31TS4_38170 [Paenibacillus sp. J31TS4]|uniref:FAD:protein FMN transferase n=1 Tax=Paenibacillus sp. J31TS4 TaxID=2807195 RepID=UPI001B1F88E7|nr:FAD:protein FMN transferase [Paenibacillus sp. J31TS4]GIP40537.1 hypothetical protein J31TS4_38170 [Paenibacillus sp. J31TS4]